MFSWHVTVKETSLCLSQPVSASTNPIGADKGSYPASTGPAPRHRRSRYAESVLQAPLSGMSRAPGTDEAAVTQVFRLAVRRADLRMGFRTDKGLALRGSVGELTATASDGLPLCSVKPAALWGVASKTGDETIGPFYHPEGGRCRSRGREGACRKGRPPVGFCARGPERSVPGCLESPC